MKKPNTDLSDKIVTNFLAQETPFKRKIQIFEKSFNAAPQTVFEQLCPSREADWINGWTVDLIYTTTGYVEPLCVFRTPASNVFGPGLWMITKLEPNTCLEVVVFHEGNDIIEYTKIHILDNGDGTCKGIWEVILTATSQQGNTVLVTLADDEAAFPQELAYFLEHGERMPAG